MTGKTTIPRSPFAPELADPFVRAVEETFEKMLGCAVSVGRPGDSAGPRDVSAVVGFAGGRRGAVVLSVGETAACRIVSRFAGEAYDETNAVVLDGVGEILNIIAGRAKTPLARETGPIDMSLPTVVLGREHEVHRLRDAPTLSIPFGSELGSFELTLFLERPAQAMRVLVADDSRVMRKLVRSALKELTPALEVVEAENGARAREAVTSGPLFDLVVLDLHMPEVHGKDVLTALRQREGGAAVPCVVVTSDPDVAQIVADVVSRAGGGDVTRWLEKPFAPPDLVRTVRAIQKSK